MTTATEFQAKVTKAGVNMDRLDAIVNGGPTVEVATDNGTVPSIAKVIGDLGDVGEAASATAADRVQTGLDRVQTGLDRSAADLSAATALVAGNLKATTAAGLSATTNGQFFAVPQTGSDDFAILYKNVSGAAVEQSRYPSKTGAADRTNHTGVQPIASVTGLQAALDAGMSRSDLLLPSGSDLIKSRLTAAAQSRTVTERLADSVSLLEFRLVVDADQNDVGQWLNRAWSAGKRAFHLPYNAAGYNWTTAHDPGAFSIWFDGCGNTVTLTGGGISYLKNTGIKSRVQNLTIIGTRATNQIFYEGMGPCSLTENIQIERVDIGFKMTGGFEPVFDNIYGRNCKTTLFHFADGVGPIVKHFTYDTDGPWYYGKQASITSSGAVATVTTTAAHGFTTGNTVTIMGAAQSQYNGNVVVTVTGTTTFTYAVTGSPATPATPVVNGSGIIFASLASSIFAMPTKGAIWLQTEGAVLSGGDSIHGGLVIEVPSYRNIEWALVGQCYFDSGLDNPGVQIINNTSDKYVRGLFFRGTWSATNTRGFQITGTASNDRIDGIFIESCPIHNNTSEGIQIDKGQNIFIDGNDVMGNNTAVFVGSSYVKPGTANSILVNSAARDVVICRNKLRGTALRWATNPNEHIYIAVNATGRAYGNDCGPTAAGFRIFNASGPSFIVEHNPGVPLGNFANDAAAATGGVAVEGWYRNGSALMVRQS